MINENETDVLRVKIRATELFLSLYNKGESGVWKQKALILASEIAEKLDVGFERTSPKHGIL